MGIKRNPPVAGSVQTKIPLFLQVAINHRHSSQGLEGQQLGWGQPGAKVNKEPNELLQETAGCQARPNFAATSCLVKFLTQGLS